jgi:hypothetical protein
LALALQRRIAMKVRLAPALFAAFATVATTTAAHAQPPAVAATPPAPAWTPPPAPTWTPPPPWVVYEHERKSVGGALALELLFPGAGSVYAGHSAGAAATWGLIGAGVAALFLALATLPEEGDANPATVALVYGGLGVAAGGRVYGLVDAVSSANRTNDELRDRLGLAGPWAAPAIARF